MHFVSSLPLHLPLHLSPSGKHFHLPPYLQPSDSCYATPSAPRNRSTKTHGFIRITITITIIQEQIHKSYINNTAARGPSEPAQIPPHLLPTAPAPSRKLSLSIFGSTTSTGVALFGAQHSRRSGTAQIPRYLLPSAPAPSMKLSLSVFGSTNEA